MLWIIYMVLKKETPPDSALTSSVGATNHVKQHRNIYGGETDKKND